MSGSASTVDPWRVTDGVIVIRPPREGDAARLLQGRDDEFRRWFGKGGDHPQPTACITRGEEVIGWVDYDAGEDHHWLGPDEVNVGYNVFAPYRGQGLATRAVMLLMHRIAVEGQARTASVLIERENVASVGVAIRARFGNQREQGKNYYLSRAIPPLTYGDGVVSIRRQDPADLEIDLAAKDDEQIDWLWLPGEREAWEAMTPDEQRAHTQRWLQSTRDDFGSGPKWAFSVDTAEDRHVAFVGCDLANEELPAGDANLSYSSHPAHRGRGYVSRAVRLMLRFVAEHTGARRVHLLVDEANAPSVRVARAVTDVVPVAYTNPRGRPFLRFSIDLPVPTVPR
ncbi:MAG: GNAT family N-acetyltransferase [Myxococcota bacterium]